MVNSQCNNAKLGQFPKDSISEAVVDYFHSRQEMRFLTLIDSSRLKLLHQSVDQINFGIFSSNHLTPNSQELLLLLHRFASRLTHLSSFLFFSFGIDKHFYFTLCPRQYFNWSWKFSIENREIYVMKTFPPSYGFIFEFELPARKFYYYILGNFWMTFGKMREKNFICT